MTSSSPCHHLWANRPQVPQHWGQNNLNKTKTRSNSKETNKWFIGACEVLLVSVLHYAAGGKPRLRKQAMQGLTKVVVNICVILSRLVMVMFFEMFRLRRENAQMSSLSR